MKPVHTLAALALATAALSSPNAKAAERCYDFGQLVPETQYALNETVQIGIGEVKVRPLLLDGKEVGAGNRFFVVKDQHIAGSAAPEMYGVNVAVQMLPAQPVKELSFKYSHQPGVDGGRAAMVEVDGVRHDWQGAFDRLDGKVIGGKHPVRFHVRQSNPGGANGWISGELKLSAKDGIRSFTIGAAQLRLDDVCFTK
jgi:hypothetical protein